MSASKFAKTLSDQLEAAGFDFTSRPIQHGQQFIFENGAVLNVFTSGKQQWQGAHEDRDRAIDDVIATAKRLVFGPGIFGR